MMSDDQERKLQKQGQRAALVIAGSMTLWLIIQFWLGPMLGIPGQYALLIDLAVMAAMVYALVQAYFIWRARRDADKG